MAKKSIHIGILLLIFTSVQGCKSWHTLEFETRSQPIQFGPHLTSDPVDTLGIISGYYKQYYEEEVYSESEIVGFSIEGDEYLEESLSSTVYKALDDHPSHFIADGQIEVEVKRGITFWGFLKQVLASTITGEEAEGGDYYAEIIHYTGVVYTLPEEKEP